MLPSKRMVEELASRASTYAHGDSAKIVYKTQGAKDALGHATITETETTVSCSFDETVSEQLRKEYADLDRIDAVIRFSGTKPSKGDGVKLVSKFGRTSDDGQAFTETAEFEIVGVKDHDAFGYICVLRKVKV